MLGRSGSVCSGLKLTVASDSQFPEMAVASEALQTEEVADKVDSEI